MLRRERIERTQPVPRLPHDQVAVLNDMDLLIGLRAAGGERRPLPYALAFGATRLCWFDSQGRPAKMRVKGAIPGVDSRGPVRLRGGAATARREAGNARLRGRLGCRGGDAGSRELRLAHFLDAVHAGEPVRVCEMCGVPIAG